jgi:CBS domain-containing protein
MSLESSLARPVSEMMTAHVATLRSNLTVPEAAGILANNRVSGMPVVDDGGVVVGVVTLTDFVSVLGRDKDRPTVERSEEQDVLFYDSVQLVALMGELLHPASHSPHLTVADIMSSRLVTVRESAPIRAAAQIMSKRRVHRALVTDANGKLSGIVSALDIVALLA